MAPMAVTKTVCFAIALFSVVSASSEPRGVGGTTTSIYDYPFVVSINYYYPGAGVELQRCVGSLISSWHVLTTSYCFTGADIANVKVRAGSTNSLSGGSTSGVREVITHPDYEQKPRYADIAIVVLKDYFAITESVKVVYIPPQQTQIPDGYPVKVVGWGFDGEDGTQLQELQLINTNTIDQDRCLSAYALDEAISIYDQVICTSTQGSGLCRGSSGSPLVIGEVLVGLASYHGACDDSAPDVFSRVDRHTGWILEHAVPPTREGTAVKVAPVALF